jgi:energy-coupling factor transporter ATP-binding protein EcfA2
VLIGVNGSGKSHLMKVLYASITPFERLNGSTVSRGELAQKITDKLVGVFRPDGEALGRLVRRRRGVDVARVAIRGDCGSFSYEFGTRRDQPLTLVEKKRWVPGAGEQATYIPAHEVLSTYEGFLHAWENRELAFDETVPDLCLKLTAGRIRGPAAGRTHDLQTLVDQALGGQTLKEGQRFYVKLGRAKTEAHLVAEGLRKLATIQYLIATGAFAPGGILFWDEPEANLNPVLIQKIERLLFALVDSGMQVFVATHDYLLAHRLSLAAEKDPRHFDERLRFFSLHQPERNGPFVAETARSLAEMNCNALLDEFARFYDDEQAAFLGTDRADRHR